LIIDGFIQPSDLEQLVYEKLLEKGITDNDYPINPYKLINDENILLLERHFDNSALKGVIMYGITDIAITINSDRCYVSRRFTAMHELSHYWFHPRVNHTFCLDTYKIDFSDKEWQANNAAAYALMPTNIVKELFDLTDGNVDKMCETLKVSSESLKYRINEIGLSRSPKKNSFFVSSNYCPELSFLESQWLYGGL
jgi:Zn-dependent peptidase ImmA (M78 family)